MVRVTAGELLSGRMNDIVEPSKISTDSRTIPEGGFFLAIKGTSFDGDLFAKDALKRGARGVMVSSWRGKLPGGKAIIIKVRDTIKAFHDIAGHHRAKFAIPVIAVTGSNGKTTVKEMIAKVLSAKYDVLKNEGTKNNHIGVPQTLLRLKSRHEVCVLEMGMNHKGEIRSLGKMARPGVSVITNIGPSHLEFLGGLEDVFRAKTEVFESMTPGGKGVVNGDDRFLRALKVRGVDMIRFGLGRKNDFRAGEISSDAGFIRFVLNGKKRFALRLAGLHNVYNALAAISVGSILGVSYENMKRALYLYRPPAMRLNIRRLPGGLTVMNDAYNSNPLSMECALKVLRDSPANGRWVVCGDMLELGARAGYFHEALGRRIAELNFSGVFTFGRLSKRVAEAAMACGMTKEMCRHFKTHGELSRALRRVVGVGDAILVKGSRGMRMEEVVKGLTAQSS